MNTNVWEKIGPAWRQRLSGLANLRLQIEEALATTDREKALILDGVFLQQFQQLYDEWKISGESSNFSVIFTELLNDLREKDTHPASSVRVIRTDFIFRSPDIRGRVKDADDLGVDLGFAWIGDPSPGVLKSIDMDSMVLDGDPLEITRKYLDLSLCGALITSPEALQNVQMKNDATINQLLDQYLIIEQSPPRGITLKELVRGVPSPERIGVALSATTITAAAVGGGAAEAALMILTLAGGILIIGGAVILTEWLRRKLTP